jgi:hypothetical protein
MVIPSLCNTPFSALGQYVAPLPMLNLLTSTQCIHHISCFSGSDYHNLTYDHINGSFFIQWYTRTEIISLMQGHIDQYPETQLVKSSHSSVTALLILVIYVFSKQFPSLRFLSYMQCLGLLIAARTTTQDSPTKVVAQSTILLLCLQPTIQKPQPCPITLCQ